MLELQKRISKERKEEKERLEEIGKGYAKFISDYYEGKIDLKETIEKFFVPAIDSTSGNKETNTDLTDGIVAYIRSQMFRAEHPRLKRLLQLDLEARYIEAVAGHSQAQRERQHNLEKSLSNQVQVHTVDSPKFWKKNRQNDIDEDWVDK